MTILVTGYGPFDDEAMNPAWETAKCLDGRVIQNERVVAAQLPVNIHENIKILSSLIKTYHPSIIIGLGIAPGRSVVTVERFATNLLDLPTPDEGNNQPIGIPIVPEGPTAYQSTIPIKAIVKNMRKAGIPSSVSYSSGTHGCNQVLYWLLHQAVEGEMKTKIGFIHLPYLHEQVANMIFSTLSTYPPSMSLETMTKAIEIAIHTIIETKEDIEIAYGLMC